MCCLVLAFIYFFSWCYMRQFCGVGRGLVGDKGSLGGFFLVRTIVGVRYSVSSCLFVELDLSYSFPYLLQIL